MRLRLVCLDTDDYKYLRFERIVEQMKQAQGITEQLKAENQMEWVARIEQYNNRVQGRLWIQRWFINNGNKMKEKGGS